MEELVRQLLISKAMPLAITPAQRWAAAKPTSYGSVNYGLLYLLVLGLLAAIAATIVAVLVRRAVLKSRHVKLEFHDHCERAGLGDEEVNLLTYAAKLGELRTPVNIVVTEAVFHRCIQMLMGSDRVLEMGPADKKKILAVVNSAQLKLGFEDSSSLVSSRQIPEGSTITLTGPGVMTPLEVSITSAQGWEIKAQAKPLDVEVPEGTELRARYCRGGSVWEFATTLICADGRDLTLSHAQNIRFVNRRRFRRVPVYCPAMIAPYAFLSTPPIHEPKFYGGHLVEFGAAGIVVEIDDLPALPEKARVLVIMESRAARSINAIGVVLRSDLDGSRTTRLAIELTGLSESDVSELVSETNLANPPQTSAASTSAAAVASPPAPADPNQAHMTQSNWRE